MANAALLSIPQFLGPSYSGYTYTFYVPNTTTKKDTYMTSNGSATPSNTNPNPITLNSNGSTALGIWGTGFYDVVLQNSIGSNIFTWSNVSGGDATGSSSSVTGASALSPIDNFVPNSAFQVWANSTTSISGLTANSEFARSWYALTQTGNVNVSQLTSTSLATSSSAARMQNAAASAQRQGYLTWGRKTAGDPIVGNSVQGQAKIRPGNNGTIRIALLAWLDPNNSPTINVVNNWASPTFTPGNFFITSASLAIIATSSVSATAATWTDITINGTVPSNCTRVGLFVWTDSTISVNDTLDLTSAAVYEGTSQLSWRPLGYATDNIIAAGNNITPLDPTTTVNYGKGNAINYGTSNTVNLGQNLTVALGSPSVARSYDFTPVLVRAHLTADFAVSTTLASPNQLTNFTKDFDTQSNFSSGVFTAPTAGFYRVMFRGGFADPAGDRAFQLFIYKNGSSYLIQYNWHFDNAVNSRESYEINDIMALNANDTVSFFASSNAANNLEANNTFVLIELTHPLRSTAF